MATSVTSRPSAARLVLGVAVGAVFLLASFYVSAIAVQGYGEPAGTDIAQNWPAFVLGCGIGLLGMAAGLLVAGRSTVSRCVLLGFLPAAFVLLTNVRVLLA